jgi:hypothetical protein
MKGEIPELFLGKMSCVEQPYIDQISVGSDGVEASS